MKTFATLMTLSVVTALCGCSERMPGGPGVNTTPNPPASRTTTTANRPTYDDRENTFTLGAPVLSTSVAQGETKSATISISRGSKFSQDVTVKLSGLPQGISVEPADLVIPAADKEGTVQIHAANDAALGDFTMKAIGHPAQGPDATSDFKLTVTSNK